MHGQARATAQQGMDAIAVQEWARMVCGSVTSGRIGIASAPGQNGSTIDNQIASPDQMTTHGMPDREHEERLKRRCSCCRPSLTELGRTGDARFPIGPLWQATSQGQSGPTFQPVMPVLVGKSPERFEQGDEQEGLFAVGPRATACAFG
jgi:hypothetical protein